MKPIPHRRTLVLLSASLLVLPALAQTVGTPGNSESLARDDRSFLEQAAQNGHAEMEASRLAAQKAGDPQVKRFAQTMVDEHTRMAAELDALARSKGVTLPTEPSLLQKGKLKLLSSADGPAFTRRYVESFGVEAHEETIALFQKGSREAKDPQVKAFAEKGLPSLQRHLQMARGLPRDADTGAAQGGTSGSTRSAN